MVKTQISLSEELLHEVRRLAELQGWSLAETFRRGVEQLLERYPREHVTPAEEWNPPVSEEVGWCGLDALALKALLSDELEPRLPEARPERDAT